MVDVAKIDNATADKMIMGLTALVEVIEDMAARGISPPEGDSLEELQELCDDPARAELLFKVLERYRDL